MNQTNNIDDMLKQIISEKNKLEKLTKKVIPGREKYKIRNLTDIKNNNLNTDSNTKKILQIGKNEIAKMGKDVQIEKIYGIDINGTNNISGHASGHASGKTHTKIKTHKITKSNEVNIRKLLNIPESEFKNSSPEKIKEIMELLQNYIKMDKTYLIKHEELKKLYKEYSNIYNKQKNKKTNTSSQDILAISKINSNGNISTPSTTSTINSSSTPSTTSIPSTINISNTPSTINSSNTTSTTSTPSTPSISIEEDKKHQDMLKSIHSEMKDNNTNLYKQRLMILKKIKDEPQIEPSIKNKICGGLLAIFKAPPNAEYSQFPMLKQDEEKITVNELDNAYLQKHNELMTVYKAYQKLFNKVLHYKDELDKYKKLPTGSLISRNHMDKLVADQGFVMNMIDKMQDQLISQNIISNTEKVPVNPVISNPKNIETFNNTMRDQIKHIIDRQVEVKPNMKIKIENLLSQYKDCDSNDQFCNAGRKLLLIKKM